MSDQFVEQIREALPESMGGEESTAPIAVPDPSDLHEPEAPETPLTPEEAAAEGTISPESASWLKSRLNRATSADRDQAKREEKAQRDLLEQSAWQFEEVGVTFPKDADGTELYWDEGGESLAQLNERGLNTILGLRERGYSDDQIEELGIDREYIDRAGAIQYEAQLRYEERQIQRQVSGLNVFSQEIHRQLDGTPVDHDEDLVRVLSQIQPEDMIGMSKEQAVDLARKAFALRDEVHKARVVAPQTREAMAMADWGTDSREEWLAHLEDLRWENPREFERITREVYAEREVEEIRVRAILFPESIQISEAIDSGSAELKRIAANNAADGALDFLPDDWGIKVVHDKAPEPAIDLSGPRRRPYVNELDKTRKAGADSAKHQAMREALKAAGVPQKDIDKALAAVK